MTPGATAGFASVQGCKSGTVFHPEAEASPLAIATARKLSGNRRRLGPVVCQCVVKVEFVNNYDARTGFT